MSAQFEKPSVEKIYDGRIMIGVGETEIVTIRDSENYLIKANSSAVDVIEIKMGLPLPAKYKSINMANKQRYFLLHGRHARTGVTLTASHDKKAVASLKIDVSKVIPVKLVLHRVYHTPEGAKKPEAHSKRYDNETELRKAISVANEIFRQIAIRLDPIVRVTALSEALAPILWYRGHQTEDILKLKKTRIPRSVNIFLLNRVFVPVSPDSSGVTVGHDCFIDSRPRTVPKLGRLLAHEAGHAIGGETKGWSAFHKPQNMPGPVKAQTHRRGQEQKLTTLPSTGYLMSAVRHDIPFDWGIPIEDAMDARVGATKIR